MSTDPGQFDESDKGADAEIVARLSGAFEALTPELVERCRAYLKLVAQQSVGDALQAKLSSSDLVQETLLQAWHKRDQFRGSSENEFLAWLQQILHHHLVDQQRRYLSSASRDVRLERPIGEGAASGLSIQANKEAPRSPLSHAELAEESARLRLAMASLSPDHRKVLQLRNWEGLDFTEIGRRMDRSAAAARQLWVRALARLQQVLEQDDEPRSG